MATRHLFDVIVVGGGIAGSTLAGVLARTGLGVMIVEKEGRFRDRVRGEATLPWGLANALSMGLGDVLRQAGCVDLRGMQRYDDQRRGSLDVFASHSIDGLPEVGFSHPRLQEAALSWAEVQGATAIRPARAVGATFAGTASLLRVAHEGRESDYQARLIVGADGKLSMARRWFGAATSSDPEVNRFGGVLVSGVRTDDRDTDNIGDSGDISLNWFAQSADMTRLYLMGPAEVLRAHGVDRSFDALIAVAAGGMPEGSLDDVRSEGPIGFFPNSDIWPSRIAGDGIVLIGDAAGSVDPTQGHGTSMIFRDVRELSELLVAERDWTIAIAEFEVRRRRYYDVIHEYDRWVSLTNYGVGDAADRAREGHKRAEQDDPTLGGFAFIEGRGPDGLVADEAARRTYFGEGL